MRATATAGASTYAGIVRLATAAQTAKAPFIHLADRCSLLLLPITLACRCSRGMAVVGRCHPRPQGRRRSRGARPHTAMFNKTGTLTLGGAWLIAVETAPGENADEVLRVGGTMPSPLARTVYPRPQARTDSEGRKFTAI
jgi:cation transport ATPase